MKIGAKLIGGFCIVALLVAAVGITGSIGLNRMGKSADIILDEKVPIADASMEGMIALISGRDAMGEFLLTSDPGELDNIEKEFKQTLADFDKEAGYIQTHASEEVSILIKEADGYHNKFETNAGELMEHHRMRLATEAMADTLMGSFDQHTSELKKLLGDYEEELTRDQAIDERVDAAMESKTMLVEQQAIAEEYMGLKSLDKTTALRKDFAAIMAEFDALEHLLPATVTAAHADFAELATGKDKLFDQKDQALRMLTKTRERMQLVDEFSVKGDETMDRVEEAAGRDMNAAMAVADSTLASSNLLIIGITVVAFLLAIGIGYILGRSIATPLQKTVNMIEEMEKGHLDLRLNMDRKDEIGQMAKTMDSFADSLQNELVGALIKLAANDLTFEATPRDDQDTIRGALQKAGADLNTIVSQMNMAGEQVASASGQVSDASQSLSQGATQQASSLEEITSSMTEMGSQTKTNAENASQANQLAGQARSAADKGNNQMQEMVAAMAEINEAGQNISKIIKVIDEIAFQTNLLALNAAVEAARAGRHGKGFAVVAEEVRNLAARSAQAARETAELIEGSVAKTENGSAIAGQTAEALGEIVTGITKVSDLIGEIAAASSEQALGISQVSEGLNQIDQVTQQNTASAEESAAASEELSAQALQMRDMLARFKLKTLLGAQYARPAALPQSAENSHWGGAPPPAGDTVPNRQVIALDDAEFGKY